MPGWRPGIRRSEAPEAMKRKTARRRADGTWMTDAGEVLWGVTIRLTTVLVWARSSQIARELVLVRCYDQPGTQRPTDDEIKLCPHTTGDGAPAPQLVVTAHRRSRMPQRTALFDVEPFVTKKR